MYTYTIIHIYYNYLFLLHIKRGVGALHRQTAARQAHSDTPAVAAQQQHRHRPQDHHKPQATRTMTRPLHRRVNMQRPDVTGRQDTGGERGTRQYRHEHAASRRQRHGYGWRARTKADAASITSRVAPNHSVQSGRERDGTAQPTQDNNQQCCHVFNSLNSTRTRVRSRRTNVQQKAGYGTKTGQQA